MTWQECRVTVPREFFVQGGGIGGWSEAVAPCRALVADPPLGIWGPVFVGATFYLNVILFRDVSGAIINPGVAWGLWIVAVIEKTQEKKWNIVLFVLSELIGAFCAGYATRFVMWRQKIMARASHALASARLTSHMHDSRVRMYSLDVCN